MNNNLILFPSMTAVLKAREVLRRRGINSRVIRTPANLRRRGMNSRVIRTPANLRRRSCGYSLLVKRGFDEAVSLIKNENIKTVGIAAVDLS